MCTDKATRAASRQYSPMISQHKQIGDVDRDPAKNWTGSA